MEDSKRDANTSLDVAIVGMAGRFPGARDLKQFWANLCAGVESITTFTSEELAAAGVDAAELLDPDYVKSTALLDDVESFDAGFFKFTPLEASTMDPQQRLFIECCWHALEDAGYDPAGYKVPVGVYAGAGLNTYLIQNVIGDLELVKTIGLQQLLIDSDKDFLPTHVSYKLNLTGPSVNVNTACSTSLVAVHLARQALILGECDVALAGGVSVNVPQRRGYRYVRDGIQSPDGHCRPFDARAKGTVWGSGCGVVVLKRLADALSDGDTIRAVIKASAINNDGTQKVAFTAPSIDGQASVIAQALGSAGINAREISYVEAHGTGTEMGDPVELAALTRAFAVDTDEKAFCAIGSVKSNIGHLNAAAGIAGLIKTVLALESQQLPATLHYESPNPKIDFANSPFFVNSRLRPWHNGGALRRAGVSSLGIGGTNAHVIVEEAPKRLPAARSTGLREEELILSARTLPALEAATKNLIEALESQREVPLADVAFTLKCGRGSYAHRRAVRCSSISEAIAALRERRFIATGVGASGASSLSGGGRLERWLKGEEVDWSRDYAAQTTRRIPLPGYPFERERHWLEPRRAGSEPSKSFWEKSADMADWIYRPQWKQTSLPVSAPRADALGRMVVFSGASSWATKLVGLLRQEGARVLEVLAGETYSEGEDRFTIAANDEKDYHRLVATLRARECLPHRIVHLWSAEEPVDRARPKSIGELIAAQERGLSSLIFIAKALGAANITNAISLLTVTRETQDIDGHEELRFESITAGAISKVLQQEYTNLSCRAIDIAVPPPGSAEEVALARCLVREISADGGEILVGYRGTRRSVQYFERLRVGADAARRSLLKPGETFLIFYGLEGIGFLVARQLMAAGGKAIILEERDFPRPETWDGYLATSDPSDSVARRIRNALTLRAMNHDFVVEPADFSDLERLRMTCASAEALLGPVRGVAHAAGASNFERIKAIRECAPEIFHGHFAAIPHSLMMLDELFRGREMRFRVMLSSLGSVLGGLGFAPIVAAGSLASGYICATNRRALGKWMVQYWDSWDVEWQKAKDRVHPAMYARLAPSVLTEEEGLECFNRVFAVDGATHLAISATDLQARYDKWVELAPLRESGAAQKSRRHARPALDTAFVGPRNERERLVADVFQDLIGIEPVGVNDNFHELGGHSLLATQLVSRLREVFRRDVELFVLMEHPTVASLSEYLAA